MVILFCKLERRVESLMNNTFAIGCLVQWYEIEMFSEYVKSLENSLSDINNTEKILIDFTLVIN